MAALPTIDRSRIALIHVAKKQLGLSEADYRAALASVGAASSKDLTYPAFEELMSRFEAGGFKSTGSAPPGGRRKAASGKEKQLWKINRILEEAGLPEAYADGIARKMFKVDRFIWCDSTQLWKITAALMVYKKKRKPAGDPTSSPPPEAPPSAPF